jgi:serine/threonine protein kinase
MNNRTAFIDFVRGLLTISPLERWSPQQAKLHPFITQQKYTGPFVPPMNLKSSSLNRSPAPGTQQQQQAAELSKQRERAQAAQAQAQAQAAAQGSYAMQTNQYPQSPHGQPPIYGNNGMYTPGASHAGPPPPYVAQQSPYGQMVMNQAPATCTNKLQSEQDASERLLWTSNRVESQQRFRESQAIWTQANQFDSSQAQHTILHLLTVWDSQTPVQVELPVDETVEHKGAVPEAATVISYGI